MQLWHPQSGANEGAARAPDPAGGSVSDSQVPSRLVHGDRRAPSSDPSSTTSESARGCPRLRGLRTMLA